MSKPFALIVTDTSPLITLALADELDALTRSNVTIRVPDAVIIEAIRLPRAGAPEIQAWINSAPANVRIVMTDIGRDQVRRLAAGESVRNMGELAAFEIANEYILRNPQHRGKRGLTTALR